MTKTIAECACDTDCYDGGSLAQGHHWTGFAATPSFGLMALLRAAFRTFSARL
ncbi:MAG: hypothetical protein K0R61_2042, partial [Microvirga sp.]|nr:hypothetical protein [Microvirga sp.]